jgi:hypothetical protein
MTEVSSGGAIAGHHATPEQHRAGTAYLRSLTVVIAILGGGGVRAVLIRRRMGYFCSDRTVRKVKLHSTDGVPTPPFKRGVVRVQEMYSPGKTSPTATGEADRETRPSK